MKIKLPAPQKSLLGAELTKFNVGSLHGERHCRVLTIKWTEVTTMMWRADSRLDLYCLKPHYYILHFQSRETKKTFLIYFYSAWIDSTFYFPHELVYFSFDLMVLKGARGLMIYQNGKLVNDFCAHEIRADLYLSALRRGRVVRPRRYHGLHCTDPDEIGAQILALRKRGTLLAHLPRELLAIVEHFVARCFCRLKK